MCYSPHKWFSLYSQPTDDSSVHFWCFSLYPNSQRSPHPSRWFPMQVITPLADILSIEWGLCLSYTHLTASSLKPILHVLPMSPLLSAPPSSGNRSQHPPSPALLSVTHRAGPDQLTPDVRLHSVTFGHSEQHSTIWARTLVISLLLYLFFCIYFVTWHLVPITYRMYTSWPHIYFCSSSGSSINSSTIVGSTQMKNLVVFQFCLRANLL